MINEAINEPNSAYDGRSAVPSEILLVAVNSSLSHLYTPKNGYGGAL